LGPSSRGVETPDRSGRQLWAAAVQYGCPNGSAQPANAAPAIKLTREIQARNHGNLPICHPGPRVDETIPSPVLTAIVAGDAEAERVLPHRTRPCRAQGISGLSGQFAGLRRTVKRIVGIFPVEIVENSRLDDYSLLVGDREAVLDVYKRQGGRLTPDTTCGELDAW